jgi:hypothetical protein
MKLYHGTPKKLAIIKPHLARGVSKFENKRAIFLCKTFKHAALYAISKSLKGKTAFAVTPRRLIIVGDYKPKSGYVYEANLIGALKGERGQYAYGRSVKQIRSIIVKPEDYDDFIIYVNDKRELMRKLKNKTKKIKK